LQISQSFGSSLAKLSPNVKHVSFLRNNEVLFLVSDKFIDQVFNQPSSINLLLDKGVLVVVGLFLKLGYSDSTFVDPKSLVLSGILLTGLRLFAVFLNRKIDVPSPLIESVSLPLVVDPFENSSTNLRLRPLQTLCSHLPHHESFVCLVLLPCGDDLLDRFVSETSHA
jgi:hypothetical protein